MHDPFPRYRPHWPQAFHGALVLVALSAVPVPNSPAATALAPPQQGAALLKTDIMAVLAHPDDETGMASTLAHYARAKNKVIANVYCTRGEGGGNMVGTHWGPSLGILREAELRDCLSTLGVRYCYFLDRLDWAYTESASATLRKWNKEATLERLVRMIRALRPDIILTMNPSPRPGQHGHHQSAGILAIEAFTAAADPTRFPLHLTQEGLAAWQTRRLFFGGGSDGVVTTIHVTNTPPAGESPGQVAGQALANHRSQGFGRFADSPFLSRPQRFTLVKSLVPINGIETDLLAGLPVTDAPLAPVRFADLPEVPKMELAFEPRPAFANYRRWVTEHDIEHVAIRFRADLPVVAGEPNLVRLHAHNRADNAVEATLKVEFPPGWTGDPAPRPVRIESQAQTTFEIHVMPPPNATDDAQLVAALVTADNSFPVDAILHPVPKTSVPRHSSAPRIDGTGRDWQNLIPVDITPAQLVQGKVTDANDSSASFRLARTDATLFVDVLVRDDVIVSNIAPDDIRGHWRSDSVEICLDPDVGAEDTLRCYKIGIVPFDSTGVVRAARDADANQGPIEETAPGTRIASSRTPNGYRVQAAIPFAEIGMAPDQKRLGFNIIVYDGDKADAATGENINESRLAWAPRSGVQGRPEDWGRIDLD